MSFEGNTPPPARRFRLVPFRRRRKRDKPKIKKLRLFSILGGLGLLAIVSTVFGMMMAVASDLPDLENKQQYRVNKNNSVLLDYRGRRLGILQNNENVVLVSARQIAPAMKHAIISIEDKRFYANDGFDIRGIARAVVADVTGGSAAQGASTITQQFVKNALAAQDKRTLFEKLKEAALAYHLTRKWSKSKILTEYLNQIYFGNGANGIESAARVYFGTRHGFNRPGGCGSTRAIMCASVLTPAESALIAAVVASPSAFDPIEHPEAARGRRDVVLRDMLDQGYISLSQYERARVDPLPTDRDLTPPQETSESPYFTSWVRQQVVDQLSPFEAFNGGLQITTTLDLDLQRAAEDTISQMLPTGSGLPSASLVAIDNKTGEVRAMVGGPDYASRPFNLATQGQRQPGSTIKLFTLVTALEKGISPYSEWTSEPVQFPVPGTSGREVFDVRNFGDEYAGTTSLSNAIAASDNSVFARLGLQVGTRNIAATGRKLGIRTPISTNPSMTLGGLREGVTPLDMAHAYETVANGGKRVFNPRLGAPHEGPIGIHEIRDSSGKVIASNARSMRTRQVVPPAVASTATTMLEGVVNGGTGTEARLPGFAAGKTGTTENEADAWFVGWNDKYTVAVWVGYPDTATPMLTQFDGGPVTGGTYPAEIWHNFMVAAQAVDDQRRAEAEAAKSGDDSQVSTTPSDSPDSGVLTGPGTSSSSSSSSDGTDGTTGAPDGTTGDTGGDTGAPTDGTTGGGDTGAPTDGTTGGGDTGGQTPVTPPPSAPPAGGGDTGGDTGGGDTGGGDQAPATPPPATPPPATPPAGGGDTGGDTGGTEGGGAAAPTP
ncbi:MAG TPA: transglycosylase domain-containing protein [Conexibacter sp.]